MIDTNNRLSDDSTTETQTQRNKIETDLPSTQKSLPQRPAQKSILDISNWLSSSDDDSFTREVLSQSQNVAPSPNSQLKGKSSHSVFRLTLHSSPTADRSLDMIMTQPSAASQLRQKTPGYKNMHLSYNASDPIELSSPTSSPPPRKKVKISLSKANISKETAQVKSTGYTPKEWREANRATRKKEEIMAEMIIEVALCINYKVKTLYFTSKFEGLSVRSTYTELPLISWKRRVKALYNREKDVFVPCELTELAEPIYVLIYEGAELIAKIRDGTINDDLQKAKKRALFDNPDIPYHVVIMCPEFNSYIKKLLAAENKEYRRKMLEQLENDKISKTSKEKKKTSSVEIGAAEAQRLKVQTEVALGTNIFTCKDLNEAIDWLYSFTYTIGSSLYNKYERNPDYAKFGNVKLGADKASTFLKMLQHFNLVTLPKAEKIAQFYPSPMSMYQRFINNDNLGNFNGKSVVPPTVNNTMRRVFTSTDPNQVITD